MNIRSLGEYLIAWFFSCLFLSLTSYAQQPIKFDAATISGLPARNIGSATIAHAAIVSATNFANCLTSSSVVSKEHIQRTIECSSFHT